MSLRLKSPEEGVSVWALISDGANFSCFLGYDTRRLGSDAFELYCWEELRS